MGFCIYIAEEHTRHVSMCFTVAVESVLPYNKHTHPPGRRKRRTPHRQQGDVAHNTLDSRPQSSPFPALHLLPLHPSTLPSTPPTRPLLSPDQPRVFIRFHTLTCAQLLLPSFSPCLQPPLCSFRCSLLLLSVCLTAVVGFRIALFFFSQVCFISFFGIQYIYISDVRNKRNLYIQWFFFFFKKLKSLGLPLSFPLFLPSSFLAPPSCPLPHFLSPPPLPRIPTPLHLDTPLCLRFFVAQLCRTYQKK